MIERTLSVPAWILDQYNAILAGQVENEQDGVMEIFNADFGNGIEADIKVIAVPDEEGKSGQSYVDPVLFLNGDEVAILSAKDSLDGEYPFHFEGQCYTVHMVKE